MPVSIIKPTDNGASGCSSSPSLIFTAAQFDLFARPLSESGARFHPAMTKTFATLEKASPNCFTLSQRAASLTISANFT